jgi:hypothetical protein
MNQSVGTWLLRTPRVLASLFAVFLALFALDVFSEKLGLLQTGAKLLLHLVPTFVVFGIVGVVWRREWFGAVAFGAFAMAFVGFPWRTHGVIYGPLLLIAALYLFSWWQRTHTGATREQRQGAA